MASKKILTPWINVPKNINTYEGFTYLITNLITNQKYIGRKYLISIRKKRILGKKRKLVERKESDWQIYKSSSKDVQKAIKQFGINNFSFKILKCYITKGETNFAETELLFKKEVLSKKIKVNKTLEIFEYYNGNILSRYFRNKATYPEDYKLKYDKYILKELKAIS